MKLVELKMPSATKLTREERRDINRRAWAHAKLCVRTAHKGESIDHLYVQLVDEFTKDLIWAKFDTTVEELEPEQPAVSHLKMVE